MSDATITFRDFERSGAPDGTAAYLDTFNGTYRVTGVTPCGWAHCPDANAGLGLSFAMASNDVLRLHPARCEGCDEERAVRPYRVRHHDGSDSRAFYCDGCAHLAARDFNGETAEIQPV